MTSAPGFSEIIPLSDASVHRRKYPNYDFTLITTNLQVGVSISHWIIVLRKGQKLTKSGRGIGPLKKQTTYRVSDLQVDNKLPTYYRVVMRKVSVNVTASGL